MINFSRNDTKILSNYRTNQEEEESILVELLTVLAENKWIIILITLIILFIGIAKAFIDKPVYKADVLLQIDEKPRTVLGIEPLTDLVKSTMPVMAEIELIKSRMVLGEAIKNMDLAIVAKPKYFPLIGEAIARKLQQRSQNNTISNPILGQSHYAWGGEVIQVDTLTVPDNLRNKELILLAGEEGHFQIIYEDEIIIEGEVGKLANKQINRHQQPISIFVSLLKSRPGTQFIIKLLSENVALTQLEESLFVSEKGKQTGILELTLESSDPKQAAQILNEIANIYVRQNVEYKSAESQKALEFLDKQLPELKKQMEIAASNLNEYRNRKGSIDLDIETQNILKGSVEVKTQITLLQQRRDELRQRFTESHPSVIAVDRQISRLKEQSYAHDNMIKALPATKQVIVDLSGNLEVSTNLYNTLLNNAQTLKVIKAGTVGDVRIIDYAVLPDIPFKPKRILVIGFALIFGIFVGVAVVYLRKMLNRGIKDPDLIEKQLHIPVYATISYSKSQEVINKDIRKYNRPNNNVPALLAKINHEDNAIESLRSLRTTLHFSLLDAKNNIVLISGPSPNVGKTFIAMNLATVMADSGKKVLLIDADLRKGAINTLLGISRNKGLSEIVLNTITLKEVIHKIPLANIDFISTGALPPNPSELLLHERFGIFLETLTKSYDLVIIDSPPILAATDAAIIGQFASATFMVVKSGINTKRELEQSIKRFAQSGTNIKGIVFNGVPESSLRYGYIYQYSYKNN
ncbi:MAG: polysaccharide biosynthesis tyrosine autokinase [Proteobacteria bacterium]|nr:polysaccharide biosynthesis tyrosine autokinase [Pseudomonadota bacterium]